MIATMEFFPYKIFETKGKKYLYTITGSGVFEIEDNIISILQCGGLNFHDTYEKVKNLMTYEQFSSYLKDMAEAQLLKCNEETSIMFDKTTSVKSKGLCSLTLMLAQECNLKCVYCYGDGGEYGEKGNMSTEIALKAVDFLVQNSKETDLYIVFFGGEPLLRFDLIQIVVNYCNSIKHKTLKKFFFSITTNGTLINSNIEKFLLENHFSVQISIDGIKEKHDANRFYANGSGSYDNVLKNTENMRDKKILVARATASSINLNYREIFEHLYSIGFSQISIAAAQNVLSEEDFERLLCEYKKYLWHFYELIKDGEIAKASRMNDILTPLKKIEFGSERELSCGVARTMYAVDIEGALYPCHRFVSNKGHILGNIFDGVNSKRDSFINGISIRNHCQCSSCWAVNLCLGGCPHENMENTGDIRVASNRTCRFMCLLYEELIKIYIRLTEEEKEILFN